MKVEKVGVDDVRERIKQWSDKKAGEEKGRDGSKKRKRVGDEEKDDASGEEEDSVKDKFERKDGTHDSSVADAAEAKGTVKEETSGGSSKASDAVKKEVRPAELDRTADDDEEAMMAAMGFKGFGGSRKT